MMKINQDFNKLEDRKFLALCGENDGLLYDVWSWGSAADL